MQKLEKACSLLPRDLLQISLDMLLRKKNSGSSRDDEPETAVVNKWRRHL